MIAKAFSPLGTSLWSNMANTLPIRVVLVDDHIQIHKIVETTLRTTPDIK